MRPLTPEQRDRAVGAVLASAVGDALGAPYEFGPAYDDDFVPEFGHGMGGEAPGGWTDDTAMAVPILQVLAAGGRIDDDGVLAVVEGWVRWRAEDGRGIGIQISRVLAAVGPERTESRLRAAADALHRAEGRSGGNGALMRIAPLALGYLDEADEAGLIEAAARLAALTHAEEDNAHASALWVLAVRRTILTGELDVAAEVGRLPEPARPRWERIVDEALHPARYPRDFRVDADGRSNGWGILAFQSALSAVAGARDLPDALERAVRGGGDTDTVAVIAGMLAGARWGAAQVPEHWRRDLHGWPGLSAGDMVRLAGLAAEGGGDRSGRA